MDKITSLEMLESVYSRPVSERSLWKELDHINQHYQKFTQIDLVQVIEEFTSSWVNIFLKGSFSTHYI